MIVHQLLQFTIFSLSFSLSRHGSIPPVASLRAFVDGCGNLSLCSVLARQPALPQQYRHRYQQLYMVMMVRVICME